MAFGSSTPFLVLSFSCFFPSLIDDSPLWTVVDQVVGWWRHVISVDASVAPTGGGSRN